MKVKIKKMSKEVVAPFKTYESDFCYDCIATSCEEIAPNVYKYGLGLSFQIDREFGPMLKGLVCVDKDIEKASIFAAWVALDCKLPLFRTAYN